MAGCGGVVSTIDAPPAHSVFSPPGFLAWGRRRVNTTIVSTTSINGQRILEEGWREFVVRVQKQYRHNAWRVSNILKCR